MNPAMIGKQRKKASEVFGMSNTVLPDSYVDRGALDDEVMALLGRPTHIALRGESKCGKSWLRQTVLPDALVVQCRLGTKLLAKVGVRNAVEARRSPTTPGLPRSGTI